MLEPAKEFRAAVDFEIDADGEVVEGEEKALCFSPGLFAGAKETGLAEGGRDDE